MHDFCDKHIHFIGVGGVGVNALAMFCLDIGAKVSGSDAHINGLCEKLISKGASVWMGEKPSLMTSADIVVFSSAIKENNKELAIARKLNMVVYERFEFLAEVSKMFGKVIAIAGTHGKTTTTSMLTHILSICGKNFVAMIGGESVDFSNYVNNTHEADLSQCIFVCEACEYRRSLLSLYPDIAVVLNAECDHPDCYNTLDDVNRVFSQFLLQSNTAIVDEKYEYLLPQNCLDNFDVLQENKNKNEFDLLILSANKDVCKKRFALTLIDEKISSINADGVELELTDGGDYNYHNAGFAISVARQLEISAEQCAECLRTYNGVKRRFERARDICGKKAYFDFAHHPTEIECVLTRAGSNALVVFQPHTFSRTKAYLDDFVKVLTSKNINTLVIMPTYPARESAACGADSKVLYGAICTALTAKNVENCAHKVYLAKDEQSTIDLVKTHAKDCSIVLFVGAGDIYAMKEDF